jgi:hypothetical protein
MGMDDGLSGLTDLADLVQQMHGLRIERSSDQSNKFSQVAQSYLNSGSVPFSFHSQTMLPLPPDLQLVAS